MFAEPGDVDTVRLQELVRSVWSVDVTEVRYEPVGFGTHHYLAHDSSGYAWFVNVDELAAKTWFGSDDAGALDGLDRAFRMAFWLRHAGLEFVLAPIARDDGSAVAELDGRYAVSVVPYVEGRSSAFGEFGSGAEKRAVLGALGRLHALAVPDNLPRRDTMNVPSRDEFFASLDQLESPWTEGPFAEPARKLLASCARDVRAMFARYDEIVAKVRNAPVPQVVTHGEPHAANVVWADDGGMHLIDWDTVAVAPAERDLWMVEPADDEEWAAYTSSGGNRDINPDVVELYRLWWSLGEIAGYSMTFRSPHSDDANTRRAWADFQTYLPGADPLH